MINVAECKMIIRMLEKQILDYQAKCRHKNYRGDPVDNQVGDHLIGKTIKCTCADCQYVWYLDEQEVVDG